MEVLFCLDFSKYMIWNEAIADFQLDIMSQNTISGKSLWTLCSSEVLSTPQTQLLLNSFLDLLEQNPDAAKVYKIIVPAKSTSIVQFSVNISQLEKYFKIYGDMPLANQLHGLMITADSDEILCSDKLVTSTIVDTTNLGKMVSIYSPNIQSICHFEPDQWEYRHGNAPSPIITMANFSIIISPESTPTQDIIKTQNWIKAIQSIKTNKYGKLYYKDELKLYIPTHLVLDSNTPQIPDVRILTPKYICSQPILHLHPADVEKWYSSSYFTTTQLFQHKHLLTRAEANPTLFINPQKIHFSTITQRQDEMKQLTADWHFIIDASTESFCRRTLSNLVWYRICTHLQIKPLFFLQPLIAKSSWVYQPFKQFTIQLNISRYAKWEHKLVPRNLDPLQVHMAQFGLASADFSSKYFWHRALKVGTHLHISNIEKVFDGFKLQTAKELISNSKICEVCADNKVDCLLDTCGHSFCLRCIHQLFIINASETVPCPTCRYEFMNKEWTSISRNKSTIKDLTLSRKIQFQRCLQELGESTLIVCAENETAEVVKEWIQGNQPILSLSNWFSTNIKYSNILFTWSNFKIGSTRSLNLDLKIQTILQELTRDVCKITILVEDGEEAHALEWQSKSAALFPNTIQTSTYVATDD